MIKRPILFIGTGRSGSSLIYEHFVRHEAAGWLSNYVNRFPWWPQFGYINRVFDNYFLYTKGERKKSDQMVNLNYNFVPKPTEPYIFFDYYTGINFSKDYLLKRSAPLIVQQKINKTLYKVLRYQNKKRLVLKITGPSRIEYLQSIFPDAIFIDVVRDGRAVVASLLQVDFWKQGGGYEKPWWQNGQMDHLLNEFWVGEFKNPSVLAAVQWRNIIEKTALEKQMLPKTNYYQLKYEKFLLNPLEELNKMYAFCGLAASERSRTGLGSVDASKATSKKYLDKFSNKDLNKINEIMKNNLINLKYDF